MTHSQVVQQITTGNVTQIKVAEAEHKQQDTLSSYFQKVAEQNHITYNQTRHQVPDTEYSIIEHRFDTEGRKPLQIFVSEEPTKDPDITSTCTILDREAIEQNTWPLITDRRSESCLTIKIGRFGIPKIDKTSQTVTSYHAALKTHAPASGYLIQDSLSLWLGDKQKHDLPSLLLEAENKKNNPVEKTEKGPLIHTARTHSLP